MESIKEFLNDELSARKKRNPSFSMRAFAKWLGVSPAQLSQMMTGKRSITFKTASKISDKLSLSPFQKRKFLQLSAQGDQKISNITQRQKIVEDQFQLIAEWHHFAILSLAQMPQASSDPRWIAQRLNIRVDQASQAIQRLQRLGIIETKPYLKQITNPLEIVSDTPSAAIRNYHKQCLNLALEKLDLVPNQLRQYQSLSLPLDTKQVPVLKKMIDDFLDDVTELNKNSKGPEVYNFNIQLYPVTQMKEKAK